MANKQKLKTFKELDSLYKQMDTQQHHVVNEDEQLIKFGIQSAIKSFEKSNYDKLKTRLKYKGDNLYICKYLGDDTFSVTKFLKMCNRAIDSDLPIETLKEVHKMAKRTYRALQNANSNNKADIECIKPIQEEIQKKKQLEEYKKKREYWRRKVKNSEDGKLIRHRNIIESGMNERKNIVVESATQKDVHDSLNTQAIDLVDMVKEIDAIQKKRREAEERDRIRREEERKRVLVEQKKREEEQRRRKEQERLRQQRLQEEERQRIERERKKHRAEILEVIRRRKIQKLVHFTSIDNLSSIIGNGILSIQALESDRIPYEKNDEHRLDKKTDYVCVSVEYINTMLSRSYKVKKQDVSWVIINIDPEVLLENKCIYSEYNAAARGISSKLDVKTSALDFENMFSEILDVETARSGGMHIERRKLINNYEYLPTSDQAEILINESIKPDYIKGVCFKDEEDARPYHNLLKGRGIDIIIDRDVFLRPRENYHGFEVR